MAHYNIVLFLSILCPLSQAVQDYIPVSVCPPGAREWQIEAERKKCQEPTSDYLCAAIENWPVHFGEICTKFGLSPSGTCVVLNNLTHNVDSVPCKAQEGCPDKPYSPRELYNWPVCYEDFYGKDRTTSTQTKTKVQENTTLIIFEPEAETGDSGLIISVVLAILLILICSLVVVFILDKRFKWGLMKTLRSCVRGINHSSTELTSNRDRDLRKNIHHVERQEGDTEIPFLHLEEQTSYGDPNRKINRAETQENETEIPILGSEDAYLYRYIEPSSRLQKDGAFIAKDLSWKLAALQYYFVVILKHSIKMKELKDVKVLFKRSIVEHFGEASLKSLCNLNSSDDYQNLDTSLVYNLLRNVCKQIIPPTRGWGYEPSADDVSLGADIERIRSIWNTFCDGETEFLYLKDIFVRMVDRYGNIFDDIEFQDTRRKKILTFELNPECQEEDGIVLTKAIKAVLEILEKENCVVLIGTTGTGKSTCLKYIDRHYRRNQWEVKKKLSDLDVDGKRKQLLCCDSLFGVYNRGNFAGTAQIIKALENIEQQCSQELKVVLAIHDHVYEELQKILFQNKRIVVDFNKLSDAEMLMIFNNQREHGHCAKDPKCWFRNVDFELIKDTLKENPGKLGDPILTLLYSNHHDIFAKKEATQDIVKELCHMFQNMLEKTPDLFHVLMYVMFVETHNLGNKVDEWASELGGLNSTTVEQNVRHLDAFLVVQADEKGIQISMKHELLSFALFQFCANHSRYMTLLLKHCHFQMIEEIIRPVSSPDQSEFCVILKKEMYPVLASRLKRENLLVHLECHPLMDENSKFRYILYSKIKSSKHRNLIRAFSLRLNQE